MDIDFKFGLVTLVSRKDIQPVGSVGTLSFYEVNEGNELFIYVAEALETVLIFFIKN